MSKSKVTQSVSQWQGHLLSCSGQLNIACVRTFKYFLHVFCKSSNHSVKQPEAAEADKVSICGVRPPHDWLFSKDQLPRKDVTGGHHVSPKPLIPFNPPEVSGCQITTQQHILLTVLLSHRHSNWCSCGWENLAQQLVTSDLRYELGPAGSTLPAYDPQMKRETRNPSKSATGKMLTIG